MGNHTGFQYGTGSDNGGWHEGEKYGITGGYINVLS